MYILIVNADPLGRSLAAELVQRGHEVAYLDSSAEYCNAVAADLGCLVINGETTNVGALQEAGIERADIVVVLLEKDIKNIMVGIFARQFEVPMIVSRIRQEHYRAAYQLAGLKLVFSEFDFLLNRMLNAIEDPAVKQVMRLGNGSTEIASVALDAKSPLIGRSLNSLWEHPQFPKKAVVLGVLRAADQTFILPRERPLLHASDDLLVIGRHEDIHKLAQLISRQRHWR